MRLVHCLITRARVLLSAPRGLIGVVVFSFMLIGCDGERASFTAADAQLRNVGALQVRQEAQSAAQLAIAGALGSSGFVAASRCAAQDALL